MDENIKPFLIYLPALHPELVPDTLPKSMLDEVFFIDPGLGQKNFEGNFYTPPNLVYSPKEAQACLNDLVTFQSEIEEPFTATARHVVNNFWGRLSDVEDEDLKAFVNEEGRVAKKSPSQDALCREVCEQAQKNLLLAWSQEENVLAIGELLTQLGQSSSKLADNLGDYEKGEGGSGQASIGGMVDLIMQESGLVAEDLEVQWPASLTGALCLTAPDTSFFTTAADFERLLSDLCPDDALRPQINDLSANLGEQFLPHSSLEFKFKVCDISYKILLSSYNSPLLQRLMVLDGKKREFVRFIFPV